MGRKGRKETKGKGPGRVRKEGKGMKERGLEGMERPGMNESGQE